MICIFPVNFFDMTNNRDEQLVYHAIVALLPPHRSSVLQSCQPFLSQSLGAIMMATVDDETMALAVQIAAEMRRIQRNATAATSTNSQDREGGAKAVQPSVATPKTFMPPTPGMYQQEPPSSSGRRVRTDSSSPRSGQSYMMVEPLQTQGPMYYGTEMSMPPMSQGTFTEPFGQRPEEMPAADDQLPFPPGVKDLLHWGATHVSWGKCKGLSYQEVLVANTEEMSSYRKWILARIKSGDAKIKDLANYLQKAGADSTVSLTRGEVIPGTDEVRYFKKTNNR